MVSNAFHTFTIDRIKVWVLNYLHGCDGTFLGGGNTFLHRTHVGGQSGLVTDSGWNTTEKSRHFRTSLSETENVVDKEKHVLAFLITEVFGHSQTSKSDTGTGAWGLVHLTVDQSDLDNSKFKMAFNRILEQTVTNAMLPSMFCLSRKWHQTQSFRGRDRYPHGYVHRLRRTQSNHHGPWRRC